MDDVRPPMKGRCRFLHRHTWAPGIFPLALFIASTTCFSEETADEVEKKVKPVSAEFYRSPEERREAGLGRKITEWLTISGLAEGEIEYREFEFSDHKSNKKTDETATAIQLGFNITLSELINAELVFEYEIDTNDLEFDEGVVNLDHEIWGVTVGRLYVPFGEYYSHFVSGPMVEFGETRSSGLSIDYSFNDQWEVFVFAFDGDAKKRGDNDEYDWGLGMEFSSPSEAVKIGVSYLSDLAETDEGLLEDFGNLYEERVGAWNAYALVGTNYGEVTAEIVKSTESFREYEKDANGPWAFNVEVAWFPRPAFQFSLRAEGSNELEDKPEWQYGISATWRIGKHATFAADYLYGKYKNGFVTDDDDNELDVRHQVAGQVSIEF